MVTWGEISQLESRVLAATLPGELQPPPVSLTHYARRLGVRRITNRQTGLEGCVDLGGKNPTIFIAEGLSDSRRRFTLAHELAHVAIRQFELQGHSLMHVDVERLCDRIAVDLLLPDRWIRPLTANHWSMTDLESYADTARVSVTALVNRLSDCGSRTSWLHFQQSGHPAQHQWVCWSRAGAKGKLRGPVALHWDDRQSFSDVSDGIGTRHIRLLVGDSVMYVEGNYRRRGRNIWLSFDRPRMRHSVA